MTEVQLTDKARLIATSETLGTLTGSLGSAEILALDTEFVRERTFYPELCLIQVASDSTIAAVDCVAEVALEDFYDALTGPGRGWVLHSSRQDLEILLQVGVGLPDRLIDTQVAAALLGNTPQIGYAQLVEDQLGIALDKSHTRTDWRRRPIAPAALEYAIDDVRYLLPLWHRLERMLIERQRLEWFTQDCAALLASFQDNSGEWPWDRIKGVRGLDRTSQSVARALSSWREDQAARINRPRRWLMSDEVLISLARGQPVSETALANGYELTSRFRDRHGSRLLKVIEAGRAAAPQHQPVANSSLSPAERQALKALGKAIKDRAATLDVATEILATRQEMIDWLRGTPPQRLTRGWRAEVLSDISP